MKHAVFALLVAALAPLYSCGESDDGDGGACWGRPDPDACTATNEAGETIDTRCLDPDCCDATAAWRECARAMTACPSEMLESLANEAASVCHAVEGPAVDYFACVRACDSL